MKEHLYDEELEEPRWLGWNGYIGKYAVFGVIALSSAITIYSEISNSHLEQISESRRNNTPALKSEIGRAKKKDLGELSKGLYALSEEKGKEKKSE